eukprot:g10145.t1
MCREAPYGDDIRFNEDSLRLMHNAELCDNLGNLVNRAAFEKYRLSDAADLTVRAAGATNKWIANLEPWKMKEEEKQELRAASLRKLLEDGCLCFGAFFCAVHPYSSRGAFPPVLGTYLYSKLSCQAIFAKVGEAPRPIPELRDDFQNLTEGKEVRASSLLFSQLEVQKAAAS